MDTYLFICGIVLNVLLLLFIVYCVYDAIRVNKHNKKVAAEKAHKQAQYKEELKLAEVAWQKWAEKLDELKQKSKTKDNHLDMSAQIKVIEHSHYEYFYFNSINKRVSLLELGQQNDWALPVKAAS